MSPVFMSFILYHLGKKNRPIPETKTDLIATPPYAWFALSPIVPNCIRGGSGFACARVNMCALRSVCVLECLDGWRAQCVCATHGLSSVSLFASGADGAAGTSGTWGTRSANRTGVTTVTLNKSHVSVTGQDKKTKQIYIKTQLCMGLTQLTVGDQSNSFASQCGNNILGLMWTWIWKYYWWQQFNVTRIFVEQILLFSRRHFDCNVE